MNPIFLAFPGDAEEASGNAGENQQPSTANLPLVAIVGRANVGKSTLFNRLTRSTQALVANISGVTRDRHFAQARWDERVFLVVDTGGLSGGEDELGDLVRRQAEAAVAAADLILMVLDGRQGPQPGDEEVVAFLRETGKPFFLVINKMDHARLEDQSLPEFYRFGVSPLYPVSATHGLGIATLLDDVMAHLPPEGEAPVPEEGPRVAVLGRPNVGKSSFINRVLGEERLIVSERPGTTRDAVDTPLFWQGQPYLFIDTAGLRRPSQVDPGLEKYMVLKSLKALERCQVALLLLEATEGLTQQDLRIAGLIEEYGKGCVVGINKWDLIPGERAATMLAQVQEGLIFMAYAPVVPLSVKTGHNLNRVFNLLDEVHAQSGYRAGTGELNALLKEITARTPPPRYRHRPVKFMYMTQPQTHPPTFVAFVNHPQGVPDSYRRYVVKQLRQRLNLPYAPVRLFLKGRRRAR